MTDDRSSQLPRLSRDLIASGRLTTSSVLLPTRELLALPEKAVQFGTGAFVRGFVDYFLDEANRRGDFGGRVVAIGSTASGRDIALNEQNGLYTLVVEGVGNDGLERHARVISSVSRALAAQRDWADVLALARKADLQFVFSNTTEVGIRIDDEDLLQTDPPPSFPAKLTRFLLERSRAFGCADDAGFVVIPCELVEQNGDRLKELVLALAQRWELEPQFAQWVESAVSFCNTLVDRIVPGLPDEGKRADHERSFGFRDDLMVSAEPYRLFAVEADARARERLSFARADDGIVVTGDVTAFRERKVRILNGGHTILASVGLLNGCTTVLETVHHGLVGPYLRQLLYDEIVPSLAAPDGRAFADDVLDRFANPFLRHALTDITLQHTAKMRVRVLPSIALFAERTGRAPASLAFGFAAYLLLERSAAGVGAVARLSPPIAVDSEAERVRAHWRSAADEQRASIRAVVDRVCGDVELWNTDLTTVPGFAERVAQELERMISLGVSAALESHLDSMRPAHGVGASFSNVT